MMRLLTKSQHFIQRSARPSSWIEGGLLLRGGKGGEGKGDKEGKEGIRKKEGGGKGEGREREGGTGMGGKV